MLNKFNTRIKELREELALSQEQFSKLLNCSQSTISKWESGEREPRLVYVIIISRKFKVTTDYLLGEEN